MAHIQQLIDHVNALCKKTYKEGVWVKSYITKIGKNSKGVVFFECIDAKKYDLNKPAAKVVMRLMDLNIPEYFNFLSRYNIDPELKNPHSLPPGKVFLSFKIQPALHFERGFMPIIKDIFPNDDNVARNNLKLGLRIGIENTQLGKPENHYTEWSEKDNANLENSIGKGLSIESISILLKRTPIACIEQIQSLNLVNMQVLSVMRKDALKLKELSDND
ncbi:hypothetical protein L1267_10845 [Pseudoalteromonas sp. OFAV1]|uniref:hypothetical protein n=1 Tax=Pseudoalteromonas sp. OFAV1 TaxID=2908892 RepID=UPI001F2A47F8|nr:hypothetical protein [Pseudoalteromonas sp. OFAV1]MCF2900900.1 hypothetical protein [Pseudoalteromonas sp. OFAV1]